MASILIVDDRIVNREFLAKLLASHDHVLFEACNGKEAMKMIRKNKPDVILTDILLPSVNGYELAQKLHAQPELSKIPIIFYTSTYRSPQALLLGKSCGVQFILPQPSEPNLIIETVNKALNIKPKNKKTVVRKNNMSSNIAEANELASIGNRLEEYLDELVFAKKNIDVLLEKRKVLAKDRAYLRATSEHFFQNLDQLKKISKRLYRLLQLNLDLISQRDPEILLQVYCKEACKIMEAKYSGIGIYDKQVQKFCYYIVSGNGVPVKKNLSFPIIGQGLLGDILKTRSLKITNEIPAEDETRLPPNHATRHSFLGAPLITNRNHYGFIYFSDKLDKTKFTEDDIKIAAALALEIALLYENIELYDTLQNHAAKLQIETSKREIEAEASKTKSLFLAAMSHEIRTPLNGIVTMTQLLLNSSLSKEQREEMEIIRISQEQLMLVISGILDFSKIESKNIELDNIEFNLEELANDVVIFFKKQISERKIKIRAIVDKKIPTWVVGDYVKIRQILFNILGNAVKFTERGSINFKIHLEKKQKRNLLVYFEISDTGIGITPQVSERIFKPFSQGDASITRKYGGTGLGLIISKSFVQLMGGRINYNSIPGKGSSFYFTIPLTESLNPIKPIASNESSDELPSFEKQQGIRILLAEDNVINQQVVLRILAKFGLTADLASNGLEVLEALKKNSYRLILMDCQMPQMDGYEATKKIRKQEQKEGRKPIPIIAMTAHTMRYDREKCLAAGMNDYIPKPVNIPFLAETLDHWLDDKNILIYEEKKKINETLSTLIDRNRLLEIFGDDPKAIDDFLKNFLEVTYLTLKEIKKGIKNKDIKAVVDCFHQLKGSAGNGGLISLYHLSRKAHDKSMKEDWDAIRKIYKNIEKTVNQLQMEVSKKS